VTPDKDRSRIWLVHLKITGSQGYDRYDDESFETYCLRFTLRLVLKKESLEYDNWLVDRWMDKWITHEPR